ncbi:receptor expression-enhancing protein 5-like [Dermacentor albipictus]|uniref:receptor expression-enhancing protein 5-like n=1 Tax=Dermacentor albipictus TaxID=60249 RepID=UPI0038FCA486
MAQELNEELGRVLRERGVIGDLLDGVERKTKVKREQIVYGVVALVCVGFMANMLGAKSTVFISTVWPVLGSIRAIDRADVLALQKWTAYWIVYALVNVFFNFLFVGIYRYFKRIYFVKMLLLAWCAAPVQSNGANMIFQKVFAGKIFREGPAAAPAAAPGAAPAAGGKKESPDTSRKMRK